MTHEPLIMAHRGLAGYAPENTFAAYGAALPLHFGIEVDLSLTADDEIVMVHDRTLDRTTSGAGPVSEMVAADIRRLDAGSWFHAAYADQRVPTLRETLAFVAERAPRPTLVALDLKPSETQIEARVAAMVASYGLTDQVMAIGATIQSAAVRRRFRQADPALPTARLVQSAQEWDESVLDADVDWLYIRFVPTAEQVAAAHGAGKRIFKGGPLANGIEPDVWRALRDLGVDSILSDYPLLCREALQ